MQAALNSLMMISLRPIALPFTQSLRLQSQAKSRTQSFWGRSSSIINSKQPLGLWVSTIKKSCWSSYGPRPIRGLS